MLKNKALLEKKISIKLSSGAWSAVKQTKPNANQTQANRQLTQQRDETKSEDYLLKEGNNLQSW